MSSRPVHSLLPRLLVLVALLISACSSDPASTPADSPDGNGVLDGGSLDDTTEDADVGEVTVCTGATDGTPCDDGDACTEDDTCTQEVCTGGQNTPCDAGPCQVAGCDAETGCYVQDAEEGTSCELSCFGLATCVEGACVADAATANDCPESTNPCVSEIGCDPATGECTVEIPAPDGFTCDLDDNICTLDQCDGAGTCASSGDLKSCEDESSQSPCWTWSCNGKAGCVQTTFIEGGSCNDGNACTTPDLCIENELGQKFCEGEPLPLDDENPCTSDACEDGIVTHDPVPDGVTCPVTDCDAPGTCTAGACVEPASCGCEAVDGGWSDWVLGDCVVSETDSPDGVCGEGEALAQRTCSDPAPECGGADCEGPASEVVACEVECTPGTGSTLQFGMNQFYDDYDEMIMAIVPDGVYSIEAYLIGGGGGGGFPGHGGGGAQIGGIIPVVPGMLLGIVVGDGGDAHGGGGGLSMISSFDGGSSIVYHLIAAGGGGAGSDGCNGCGQEPGSAANGGGGGAHGIHYDPTATGQAYQCLNAPANNILTTGGIPTTICEPPLAEAGGPNSKYAIDCTGGTAATLTAVGAGSGCVNNSMYDECHGDGAPGLAWGQMQDDEWVGMSGGPGFMGSYCAAGPYSLGGGIGIGGLTSNGNGSGGAGGGGFNGGGGGGGMQTYLGAGGGGGISWAHENVAVFLDLNSKGQTTSDSVFCQLEDCVIVQGEDLVEWGRGGDAGDHENWPQDYSAPSEGTDGAIIIFVPNPD